MSANEMPKNVTPVTTFKTKEKKVIWVKKGNIAQTQVDIIVNTTSPELNLDCGAVSTAILNAGGQQIQKDCDLLVGRSYGNHQKKVPMGQFLLTSAGKMARCKRIYHAVCPPYSVPNSEEILSSLVYNILVDANTADMTSIAFPALGTGVTGQAGFPAETIAKIICHEMIRFSEQVSNGSLFDLRLVVHWHQDNIFKAFQHELGLCNSENKENAMKAKPTKELTNKSTKGISRKQAEPSSAAEVDVITVISDENTQESIITLSDSPVESPSSPPASPVYLVPIFVDGGSDCEIEYCLNPVFVSSSNPPTLSMSKSFPPEKVAGSSSSSSTIPGPSSSPDLHLLPDNEGDQVKFENLSMHKWGTTSMWMEHVVIQVTKGDLASECTDAIVVQTSNSFDLKGNMAKAVINKGGPSIVQQCSWKRKNLQDTVLCTTGGNLKCDRVIFIALEDAGSVKQRTLEALNVAEKEGMRSIAIPALGTGQLGGDAIACASELLDAIGDFIVSTNPQCVNRIKIIIFDSYMLDSYKSVFEKKVGQSYGNRKRKVIDDDEPEDLSPAKTVRSYEEEVYCKQELSYDSDLMGAMNGSKLKEVKACAAKYKVTVTPLPYGQRHIKSFQLEGRRLDVLSAKSDIQQLYLTLQKQYNEHKHAHKLCENVEWKWWSKEESKYITYDIDVTAEIEQAYQTSKPFVDPPQLAGFRIDLQTMKEIDLSGGFPVKETTVQRIAKKGPDTRSDLPTTWGKMEATENLKVIGLSKTSSEYQTIQTTFLSSVGVGGHGTCSCKQCRRTPNRGFNVIKIERIQNKELFRQYQARKETMQLALPNIDVEQSLYHGTASNACDAINRRGFNRSYSGLKAGLNAYGEGTYFAKSASYSAQPNYSAPDEMGQQRMYMCKVLTGEYTHGRSGMKLLPNKPGNQNEIYDSLVDNVKQPGIFVIFHDAQAYPEYLITFA
ncbi:protein mono-ADP-ribosyltransferase PARP14-like [Amphiura filiformis]|uniref:protein mono-ADP-ribosyltransferase PARP14-like n=1 Tax=Amphiura filiformis TaxID=82378 RepID=UPI003B21562A